MNLKIGKRKIGGSEPFFTIEEGQANQGNFDRALQMVDLAVQSGADAIEFQLSRADDFYIKNHPGYVNYKKIEFSDAQIRDLIKYIKEKNIEMIACPLSHKIVALLADAGCSAFNINASDLTNPYIIDAVCNTKLPFFLSLPLANNEEIDWAVNRIKKNGSDNFVFMHGQHIMASGCSGVRAKDTALGYISSLKKKYNLPVGFIDHTPFFWMPACAFVAGADVVSKHMTWSRRAKGPDWQICLEPGEIKNSINFAREIVRSMSIKEKVLSSGEKADRSVMRRSIVAAKKIIKGQQIRMEDICFKRPGDGLDPSHFEEIIGKTSLNDFLPDEQIRIDDVGDK